MANFAHRGSNPSVRDVKILQRLVGEPQVKSALGRRKGRWECNIAMDLKEIGWLKLNWIHLSYDKEQWRAVVNAALKLPVP
jgi:hypothetical protein